MKSDSKRKPGFYWVRFEGVLVVAEYKRIPASYHHRNGYWLMPGVETMWLNSEVCELLSNRLVFLEAPSIEEKFSAFVKSAARKKKGKSRHA